MYQPLKVYVVSFFSSSFVSVKSSFLKIRGWLPSTDTSSETVRPLCTCRFSPATPEMPVSKVTVYFWSGSMTMTEEDSGSELSSGWLSDSLSVGLLSDSLSVGLLSDSLSVGLLSDSLSSDWLASNPLSVLSAVFPAPSLTSGASSDTFSFEVSSFEISSGISLRFWIPAICSVFSASRYSL